MITRPTGTRYVTALFTLGVVTAAAPTLGAAAPQDDPSAVTSTTTAPPPAPPPQGPFCSAIPPAGEGSFEGMANDAVATAASNNPYLTTLSAAVQAAGLVDTLNGPGPFTIFAPSNEAFAAVPQEDLDAILADTGQLTDILTFHVVAGQALTAADLIAAGEVTTIQGSPLTFTTGAEGWLTINGTAANVICAGIQTANATVFVIDRLLVPPMAGDLVEVL